MRIALALALSLLLSGCAVRVRVSRRAKNVNAIPSVELPQDDDLNEKPDDNHYPACPWQTEMPCEAVL